jgi:RNA polymerase sigma-70 factor, ECF subfamily
VGQEELVALAQTGDHAAFTHLARGSFDRLFRVARLTLRDRELAEDAVQEALIKAWRDLRGLRDPSRFDAWTYRLVVNACHDVQRRMRRTPATVGLLPNDLARAVPDAANDLADRDQLERAFRRLPVDQRSVIVLHHYLGMPLDEIAEVLALPSGTVKSRVHYGTRALRAAIEADARTGVVVA